MPPSHPPHFNVGAMHCDYGRIKKNKIYFTVGVNIHMFVKEIGRGKGL
jgi:hypothetical protein